MNATTLTLGDWVQSTKAFIEPDFNGHEEWVHATPNAVGHVQYVAPDGLVTVYWERAGTTCEVDPSEVMFLCHAHGPDDRFYLPEPPPIHEVHRHVAALLELSEDKRRSLDIMNKNHPDEWGTTKRRIVEEIAALDAAVNCLQKGIRR